MYLHPLQLSHIWSSSLLSPCNVPMNVHRIKWSCYFIRIHGMITACNFESVCASMKWSKSCEDISFQGKISSLTSEDTWTLPSISFQILRLPSSLLSRVGEEEDRLGSWGSLFSIDLALRLAWQFISVACQADWPC